MGRFPYLLLPAVMLCIVSCMKQDADSSAEDFDFGPDAALFIVNEGGFGNGNSSLSVYEPESGVVHNNIFRRANGVPLGDVAQSMTGQQGICDRYVQPVNLHSRPPDIQHDRDDRDRMHDRTDNHT